MLSAHEISVNDLYEAIYVAFEKDSDLIEKYHVLNASVSDCVAHTLKRIIEVSKVYQLTCYEVLKNGGVAIGFFVTGIGFLYSFGLNIQYRTKEILPQFWEIILSKLPESFFCVMNLKNKRAIKFLERNEMKIISTINSETTLIYTSCQ